MKKFISLMLVAVIAISSVFAMSGYIGASSGYGFDFITEPEFKKIGTHIPVNVDGATFFGKGNFNIGFSYGAEIASIPMTYGEHEADPADYEWTLAPYAGLAFQYRFGKSFALAGSVNATYNWNNLENTKTTIHQLGAMGNLFINMNMGSVNFRIGGLAGGPIHAWSVTKDVPLLGTVTQEYDTTGSMYITPFAGIGFAY